MILATLLKALFARGIE
ncbi:MAG: hypothetical protein ACL7BU_00630 [Candidatus Phlomobacter fragariae]